MRQLKITNQFTIRESDSLTKYLSDISKEPLLTVEREIELTVRIKLGDKRALNELVKSNLRFVVSVAKQYQNQGLMLGDLINEGNLGLIKAASRFDETRGFKFISYAVWWIRQCILQALAEQSRIVRLPLNQIGMINKINKAFSRLEQEFEREPTDDELASCLDVSIDDISSMSNQSGRIVSLDSSYEPGGEAIIESIACPDAGPSHPSNNLIHESLQHEIRRLLGSLTPRQAGVINLYFGLDGKPLTLEEIGERYELTRERVRQIKETALKKLKSDSRSRVLKAFMN